METTDIKTDGTFNADHQTAQVLKAYALLGFACVGVYVTTKKTAQFLVDWRAYRKAKKADKKNELS